MKAAFTICSNNYLAMAKAIADSFKFYHQDFDFFIFLVDKIDSSLDYSIFSEINLITISSIFSDIEQLSIRYNIIELNTSVKPFIFLYLFNNLQYEIAFYLDPDLMVYGRFNELEIFLQDVNGVITPHFCSPIDDEKGSSEIDFFPYGLYNLGFIGLKNSQECNEFLNWWHKRLMKYCFYKPENTIFTDQLWINYAPVFYKKFKIVKHLGYNVANWNLYERELSLTERGYYVNQKFPLKFFHFSHYMYDDPYKISKYQRRHDIAELPILKLIIDEYQLNLKKNNFLAYNKSIPYYQTIYNNYLQQKIDKEHRAFYTTKRKFRNKLVNYIDVILGFSS